MDMKTYMHRLQEVVPYSTRGQQEATLRTVDELRAAGWHVDLRTHGHLATLDRGRTVVLRLLAAVGGLRRGRVWVSVRDARPLYAGKPFNLVLSEPYWHPDGAVFRLDIPDGQMLRAKVSGHLVEITPSWLVDAAPPACDHHPGRQCDDACDVCLSLEGLGWRRAEIDQAAADMEVFDVR